MAIKAVQICVFRALVEVPTKVLLQRLLQRFEKQLGHAQEFLSRLLESNCTRVQSDVLNRLQESRNRLEVEIRKLLHEISRIAEQALTRARTARAAGRLAVQAAMAQLNDLEREIRDLRPTW